MTVLFYVLHTCEYDIESIHRLSSKQPNGTLCSGSLSLASVSSHQLHRAVRSRFPFISCYKDLGPTLMTSVYFQNARIDLVACWRLLNILARTDMMGSVDWQHWLRNRWGLLSRSTFWQIQRIPRSDCGRPEWPSRWNLLKRDQHSDRKTVGVTSWQGDAFGRKG